MSLQSKAWEYLQKYKISPQKVNIVTKKQENINHDEEKNSQLKLTLNWYSRISREGH